MYSAFKTIKYMGLSLHDDLEGLVIFIPAHFAPGHQTFSPSYSESGNKKASGLG
jgi:hypothetical protein